MNRIWQQLAIATNWPILAAVPVLATLGVLSIWADTRFEPAPVWQKQLMFLGIGMAGMMLFQVVNYQVIGRFAWTFYIVSLLLVGYTVVAAEIGGESPLPLVRRINGSYAWISLPMMSLQPAELVKLAFIMVLARYLRFRSNYRTLVGLVPPFLLAGLPIIMILKQPDLGTALTFVPVLLAMLYIAGARLAHLLTILGTAVALLPLAWFAGHCTREMCPLCPDLPVLRHLPQVVRHYHRQRVQAMFDANPTMLRDTGFQQHKALVAFGSGGLGGKGAGNIPVGRSVPEAHNDMVFALIGEQFGFLGAAAVLGAYTVIFAAGLEISAATREPFGKLVAPGIVALMAGQTFLNLAVAMKLMPVTGVTLPLVSYGGSSLLASFLAVGLLLNIGQNRPIVMANNAFEFGR